MLIIHSNEIAPQETGHFSYIGGKPMLPENLKGPIFAKDDVPMTFFFQICFPKEHVWFDKIVSVFSTTTYCDAETYIPKLPPSLANHILEDAFFENYETFFRFFVFDKSEVCLNEYYQEKLVYRKLRFTEKGDSNDIVFGQINSSPIWLLENEGPKSYEGSEDKINFLFQTNCDYQYLKIAGAPNQTVEDYTTDNGMVESETDEYQLFASNELYFFGIERSLSPQIYVVPQS